MIEANEGEIGHVSYANGSTVATLWGRDEWTVDVFGEPVPALADYFRSRYLGRYQGPQWGHYGQALLRQVAEDVGGEATISRQFEAHEPPDDVH